MSIDEFLKHQKTPQRTLKPLTELSYEDGQELVNALNEISTLLRRTIDGGLYVHYRDGHGWRAEFGTGSIAPTTLDDPKASWHASPVRALRAVAKMLRRHFEQQNKRRTQVEKRGKRLTRPAARKRTRG